jgi:hypothetical protein
MQRSVARSADSRDVLRAAKQRVGAAYVQARDAPSAQIWTCDAMLADALLLCVGLMPVMQAKSLASYAARFKCIFN